MDAPDLQIIDQTVPEMPTDEKVILSNNIDQVYDENADNVDLGAPVDS